MDVIFISCTLGLKFTMIYIVKSQLLQPPIEQKSCFLQGFYAYYYLQNRMFRLKQDFEV